MKACDDLGRNAVHLAAGHTGPTAQKLVELLLNNCQEQELGLYWILSLSNNFKLCFHWVISQYTVGTPGDRQNVFSLSGIRINQYRLY